MRKKKDNQCCLKKCRYHAGGQWATESGECRYWEVTGKTRLGQMTAEERDKLRRGDIRCPFFEAGPKARRVRERNNGIFVSKGVIRHQKDWTAVENLYMLGLNDYQIAKALWLRASSVQWWRRSESRPANCGVGCPKKETGEAEPERAAGGVGPYERDRKGGNHE